MRRFPAGVCLVTAGKGDTIAGMTVSSIFSLCLDPPTLVIGVNTQSRTFQLLSGFGAFGVSIPAAAQQNLLEKFSSQEVGSKSRFNPADWTAGATGVPLLNNAVATLECAVQERVTRHSHTIVLGSVVDCSIGKESAALAYRNGEYFGII